MTELLFQCPKCGKKFTIKGYWKWVLKCPFHLFNFKEMRDYRVTKCPHCKQKTFMSWIILTRY